MKKIISFVLITIMIASVASSGIFANALLLGDANGDGLLDNKDVVLLFRFVSGTAKGAVEANCDYNNDKSIDNKDVVALFRALSGGSIVEKERYVFENLISVVKPDGYTFYDNYQGFPSGVKDGVADGHCFFNFMIQDPYAPMTEADTTNFLNTTKNNFQGVFGDYTMDGFESYEVDGVPVTKLDWTWENGMSQSVVRIHFDGYCSVVINFAVWSDVEGGVEEFNAMIKTLRVEE